MRTTDRYAAAIRSSCLKTDARTTYSDSDVLGAYGLAARDLEGRGHPLAAGLERLFAGDNGAATQIVLLLAKMARGKARSQRLRMSETQAQDIAKACLAWYRDGTCKHCGGHGVMKIRGTPALGTQKCGICKGSGRVPFENQFRAEWRAIARWVIAQMEREQSRAGPAASKKLATRFELGFVD